MPFIICTISIIANAYEHIHPVPSLPKTSNIYESTEDVFTNHMFVQIHKSLFTLTAQKVMPNLISDFNVSREGNVYQFRLKHNTFHDGQILENADVKHSLELAIKKNVSGYEKLAIILGFHDFISGRSNELKGIVLLDNDMEFKIILKTPNYELVKSLTNFRFAITSRKGSVMNGLGEYKIGTFNQEKVVLESVNMGGNSPSKVIYVQSSYDNAIRLFKQGVYHDLFAYPVDKSALTQFKPFGKWNLIHTPRTYMFVANSNTLTDNNTRGVVFNNIDKKKIIQKCYSGNQPTVSIVPPGFLGFINKFKRKRMTIDLPKKLHIGIALGVFREECVKSFLKSSFASLSDIKISILDTAAALHAFDTNKMDMLFIYLESSDDFDFFQFFNPKSNFNLGVSEDSILEDKLY